MWFNLKKPQIFFPLISHFPSFFHNNNIKKIDWTGHFVFNCSILLEPYYNHFNEVFFSKNTWKSGSIVYSNMCIFATDR